MHSFLPPSKACHVLSCRVILFVLHSGWLNVVLTCPSVTRPCHRSAVQTILRRPVSLLLLHCTPSSHIPHTALHLFKVADDFATLPLHFLNFYGSSDLGQSLLEIHYHMMGWDGMG